MALLGEMTLLDGELIMHKNPFKIDEYGNMHTISYAAQNPWLQHRSIKDNILFGHPMEEDRYEEVLTCCALKPDLAILEDGDDTEIGARFVFHFCPLLLTEIIEILQLQRRVLVRRTKGQVCSTIIRDGHVCNP